MTQALTLASRPRTLTGQAALALSVRIWFAVALVGQWAFVAYILGFYGPSTMSGHFQAWSRNHMLLKGYVAGDTAGNLAFAAHVLVAASVTFIGALQLIPSLRRRAPGLHRWSGRIFLAAATIASVSGLYMVWVRGAAQNPTSSLNISLNALLILLFAALAWRAAIQRRFEGHQHWAMLLYLAVSGGWFYRAGVFAWMVLAHGAGTTDAGDSPVDYALGYGCYLGPLGVYELYRLARRGSEGGRWAMAGGLATATAIILVGVAGVAWAGWRPLLLA